MEPKPIITQEFEERYHNIDNRCKELALAILEHVKLNDVRLLKKIEIRLEALIDDINQIK